MRIAAAAGRGSRRWESSRLARVLVTYGFSVTPRSERAERSDETGDSVPDAGAGPMERRDIDRHADRGGRLDHVGRERIGGLPATAS